MLTQLFHFAIELLLIITVADWLTTEYEVFIKI